MTVSTCRTLEEYVKPYRLTRDIYERHKGGANSGVKKRETQEISQKEATFEQSQYLEEFAQQVGGSVSAKDVCKDGTLTTTGHETGEVGKCHLTGAYTLSYKQWGNFQRILDKEVE